MDLQTKQAVQADQFISTSKMLSHWQGHRNLTRKIIEAFPEKEFFSYSIGGMRPFSEMVSELLAIAGPGMKEITTGESVAFSEKIEHMNSKEQVLKLWDKSTTQINDYWNSLTPARFRESVKLFGQYEGTVYSSILYFVDNEIHHRGQGYVYLRALGVEPPAFWDR